MSFSNTHGYTGGTASADANIAGYETARKHFIGYQAGVSDSGDRDVDLRQPVRQHRVCAAGPHQDAAEPAAAGVRPAGRRVLVRAAAHVDVYGNSYDAKAYKPHSVHSMGQAREAPVMGVHAARS